MPIPIKLQVFEGPMDLLMHLIEKNKIDIYDIPIVTITDQYLEYVRRMEHDDMNVTSEFLVMAATLLDIKSRMLLPREENEDGEEEDPRDELVKRLLEYKLYKCMSEELKEKRRHAGFSYFRPQDLPEEVKSYMPPVNYEELIGDRTLESLRNVFSDVLKRKKNRVDPVRSGFGKIQREEISVADKELYIRAYLANHPHADFREMLEIQDSKEEIIVTFLVILELMKHQKIRITQDEPFGKITIDLIDPHEQAAEPLAEPEEEPMEAPLAEPEEEPAEELMEEPSAEQEEEPMAEPPAEPALKAEEVFALRPVLIETAVTEAEPEPEEEIVPVQAAPEEEIPVKEADPPALQTGDESLETDRNTQTHSRGLRRRITGRLRGGMMGFGRHAFPIPAKRMRRNMILKARGNRIWGRRRQRIRRKHGYSFS